MQKTLKAAAALALAVPLSAAFAWGQTSGVSHPEEIPITTSDEGIAQPVIYQRAASTSRIESAPVERKPLLSASASVPAVAPSERLNGIAVSDDSRAFHSNIDANVVTRVDGPSNALPAGTLIKIRLTNGVNTKVTSAGAQFSGELVEAVLRDGRVLLPAGSMLAGRVTDIHGGRRISGAASIHLQPTGVTLPDGTRYPVRGQVVDTDQFRATKVDDEGTIIRRDHPMKTLSVMGLSTGSGAAAGAVLGGWPGALIGAGVGAGVSTAVWLKQDRQTDLPAETKVTFILTSPMVFGVQ